MKKEITDRQQKVNEITEQLEQGIKAIQTSDDWKNYLNVMSKFHSYSFNNSILIALQCPGATHVAGFKAWQQFNRHVKKGSKGIRILAPCPIKIKTEDKEGNEVEKIIPKFKVISVFDYSQTEGEDLPELPCHKLTGSVKEYSAIVEKLHEVSPVPIEFENIESGANGYFHHVDHRIAIQAGMSEAQTIKTMIHEIVHSILHDKETGTEKEATRSVKELQAESVAYTVCNYFGLDTSDYSFGYVTTWTSTSDTKELQQNMEVIRKTAHDLIEKLAA